MLMRMSHCATIDHPVSADCEQSQLRCIQSTADVVDEISLCVCCTDFILYEKQTVKKFGTPHVKNECCGHNLLICLLILVKSWPENKLVQCGYGLTKMREQVSAMWSLFN